MAFWTRWFSGGGAAIRHDGLQNSAPNNQYKIKPVNNDTALQLSAVWACTRLLSESIASMPLKFYRNLGNGEREPWPDHPLAKVMSNPNRYQTRQEFFETLCINLFLFGNFFCKIDRRANGEIISLLPLMSSQMQVILDDKGERIYNYTDGNLYALSQKSVWHVPLMPSNGIVGLSPLNYAANVMGIAEAAEERVGISAKNGFKPTGVLMIDKILKPEQREAVRANFSAMQEGSGDALRVLEAGMTYQPISISPKDAQLLETRRFSIEEIARFFNVPSVLINDTAATTTWGSGISQIVEAFYKFSLRPNMEKIEASILRWLIPAPERSGVDVEFDFEALLRGDGQTRTNINSQQITSGVRTINEVRREYGWKPLPGGDEPYMQAQMTPVSKLAQGVGQNAQETP